MRSGAACVSAALGLSAVTALAEDEPAQFLVLPLLANEVAALPRLVASDEVSARINNRLAEIDRDEKDFAEGCNSDPPRSFVERNVEIAFAGPRFLSLLIYDAFYCSGAAHPNDWAWPLTFDLATGLETDLRDLFPPNLLPKESLRGPAVHFKFSQRLNDLYLALDVPMPEDCRSAIKANDAWFRVWPSAAEGGLVLQPSGLSHAEQACADPVTIPPAKLRALGFADLLTQSLAAAAGGAPAAESSGNAGK